MQQGHWMLQSLKGQPPIQNISENGAEKYIMAISVKKIYLRINYVTYCFLEAPLKHNVIFFNISSEAVK